MLGAMLGAHLRVLTIPEFQFKITLLSMLHEDFCKNSIPKVLAALKSDLLFEMWSFDSALGQIREEDFDGSYRQFVEYFVSLYGTHNEMGDFDHWIDHTPSNIDHAHFLLNQFPESVLIHIVRDGRAVAASVLPLDWGPHTIRRAAEEWQLSLSAGLAAEVTFPDNRVLRVQYESLVREPVRVLKEVCGFLAIEYEDEMELGKGFSVPSSSEKQHALVGSLPDATRIDAWRKRLSPDQIDMYEYYAGNMLALMGYKTTRGIVARAPSSLESFRMSVADLLKPYLKSLHHHRRHGETMISTVLRKTRKQQ